MRRSSARYRLRRPDLPGAPIVVLLEKLPILIHKRGIASSGIASDFARLESLKVKQRHIHKFIGRVNIGSVAAFPTSPRRVCLFLPLSVSPCAKLLFWFTLIPARFPSINHITAYCRWKRQFWLGGFAQCRVDVHRDVIRTRLKRAYRLFHKRM